MANFRINKKHRQITGGQAVVKSLKKIGVKHVFGLIGSAAMEIFDALYDCKEIKFIGVRDERTGTHMADGYARITGKPGIMIAGQNGPGATNLVTGVAQAAAAFSPVITIAGDISSEHSGKDSFQEVDQQTIFEPITKKTFSINKTSKIPEVINDAFKIALKPRCGPVHINIPRDVLSNKSIFKDFKKFTIKSLPSPTTKDLKKVIAIIENSSQPVIIAGGGIKNSKGYKEVISFAHRLNIPITSSAGHGDAIPYSEKLYAGQIGPRGNVVASKLIKEADVIIALGTRLGFNSTFFSYDNINKNAHIIQIDVEKKALGRYFPISIGICADAKTVAKKLYEKSKTIKNINKFEKWTKKFLDNKKKYLIKRDLKTKKTNHLIQPENIFKILRETIPKNSAITLDAGTLCLQATDSFNHYNPPCFFTPLDFGLVGFSFACGLGVKLAKPNSHVISLIGDGGFGMTISELSTAVQNNIKTIIIVMNNECWGAEKAYQRDFFNKRYIGSDLKNPPFHKIAELYGAKGYKVNKLLDLEKTIQAALSCNKPAVINIEVDPKALYSFRKDSFKHKLK